MAYNHMMPAPKGAFRKTNPQAGLFKTVLMMLLSPLLKLCMDAVLRLETPLQATGEMWVIFELPFFFPASSRF